MYVVLDLLALKKHNEVASCVETKAVSLQTTLRSLGREQTSWSWPEGKTGAKHVSKAKVFPRHISAKESITTPNIVTVSDKPSLLTFASWFTNFLMVKHH